MVINHKDTLEKLERLRELYEAAYVVGGAAAAVHNDEICMLYGALEEVISRFAGMEKVVVRRPPDVPSTYPNYIAARILSGTTSYTDQGYRQSQATH